MISMDINKVLELLPHRYPFLMVDKVLDCEPNKSLVAIKNVSYNEPFFAGHFPGHPVMPGVLILESMAQATGLLAFYSRDEKAREGVVYYLVGVDKARFKKPVQPGAQLRLEVELKRTIRDIFKFSAVATVDDEVVCTAEFMTTKMEGDN